MTLSGANNYRAELKSSEGGKLDYDSEYWVGFAFRVEKWDKADWGMLFQTHGVPSTWDGCKSGRNPVSILVTKENKLALSVVDDPKAGKALGGAGGNVVWSTPLDTNTWQRWVIRVKPSKTNSGVIEAWLNGKRLWGRTGANVDALDTCGKPQDDWIYTKFGIYREYVNAGSQKIVYDDIRVYKGPAGYNKVRPPGLPAQMDLLWP